MKLAVYVGRDHVASLDRSDAYKHVMTYLPNVGEQSFVSLTMPVRIESWVWPQGLHPFFQQNLPEGLLLAILRDQAGSLFDGTDLSLLAIVGRNAIGRVRIATEGADPFALPQAFDVREVLEGENSDARFTELVRRYATSGVSGIFPKFLSTSAANTSIDQFNKASVRLSRHIVKGSSERLPYLALNEHLTMEVGRRAGLQTAATRISDDGRALLVDRFDINGDGDPIYGLEDFCGLLGLTPAEKYSPTWERIVSTANEYLPASKKNGEFAKLAMHILATYVLRNADCHSKNIALYYTSRDDVSFAPVYDMVTVTAYPDYRNNSPGLALEGRKTWLPGNSLERFLQVRLGVPPRKQAEMIEKLADAVTRVATDLQSMSQRFPGFRETGERMLAEWNSGLNAIRTPKVQVPVGAVPASGGKAGKNKKVRR